MKSMPQLFLLVGKNWKIKRRSVFMLILEMMVPIIFACIAAFTRKNATFKDVKTPTFQPLDMVEDYLDTLEKKGVFEQLTIAYTPLTPAVKEVMWFMYEDLHGRINNGSVLEPIGFETEEEATEYVERWRDISMIVVLEGRDGDVINDTLPTRLNLTLRPVYEYFDEGTTRVYNFPPRSTPQCNQPRSHSLVDTMQFMMFKALTKFWLKERRRDPFVVDWNPSTKCLPWPPYMFDKLVWDQTRSLPLFVLASFLMTVIAFTKMLVAEKELKLKEVLKMMGVKPSVYWISYFITAQSYLIPILVVYTALLSVHFSNSVPTGSLEADLQRPAGPVIGKTSPSLFFAFLFCYGMAITTFCFMISTFIKRANIAAVTSCILFFMMYMPYRKIVRVYINISRYNKLASCLSCNVAMSLGVYLISIRGGTAAPGLSWMNFYEPLQGDDLSLADCMMMLTVDTVIHCIVAWYVDQINPGETGVAKKPWFLFTKSYWRPAHRSSLNTKMGPSDIQADERCFEPEPTDLEAGIQMRNLRKVFGNKVAVHDSNLDVFEGQITVLLGHNGAGKTVTMSMLTGLMLPTAGTAIIDGYDVCTELEAVRSTLGLCPQYNILYSHMTVYEHLEFFAALKDCPGEDIDEECMELIEEVGLEDKRDYRAGDLSGGQKRKLSVAISLVGGSRVVILDEPTAGMDPAARRQTWDVLKRAREGRTILLTTHYMDEADMLGDRIAIMAAGVIECCGSSMFLKKLYGSGYHLIVNTDQGCDILKLFEMIREHVYDAEIEAVVRNETTFLLPMTSAPLFSKLFEDLDALKNDLKVISFGISTTSMEEVFLKVETSRNKTGDITIEPSRRPSQDAVATIPMAVGPSGTRIDKFYSKTAMEEHHRKSQVLKEIVSVVKKQSIAEILHLPPNVPGSDKKSSVSSGGGQKSDASGGSGQKSNVSSENAYNKSGRKSGFGFDNDRKQSVGFTRKQSVTFGGTRKRESGTILAGGRKRESGVGLGGTRKSATGIGIRKSGNFSGARKSSASLKNIARESMTAKDITERLNQGRTSGHASFAADQNRRLKGFRFACSVMWALLVKKFTVCVRSKISFLLQTFMPLVIILAMFKSDTPWAIPPATPLVLDLARLKHPMVPFDSGQTADPSGAVVASVYGQLFDEYEDVETIEVDLNNVTLDDYVLYEIEKEGHHYVTHHLPIAMALPLYRSEVKLDTSQNEAERVKSAIRHAMGRRRTPTAYFNDYVRHSRRISMNYLLNALVQTELNNENETFYVQTILSAYDLTRDPENAPVVGYPVEAEHAVYSAYPFAVAVGIGMPFSVIQSLQSLIVEKKTGTKHMQILSGAGPVAYWVIHFVFDFCTYCVSASMALVAFFIQPTDSYTTNWSVLALVFLCYGWVALNFIYLLQFVFKSPATAAVFFITISILTGILSTRIVTVLNRFGLDKDIDLGDAKTTQTVFSVLLPQFNLMHGVMGIHHNFNNKEACGKRNCSLTDHKNINCCPKPCTGFCFDSHDSYFAWNNPGIGSFIAAMLLQGTALFSIVLALDFRLPQKLLARISRADSVEDETKLESEDEDVANERKRVLAKTTEDLQIKDSGEDMLTLVNLYKCYGQLVAVDRICVGVARGECFGLLGQNGAGKTSTFKVVSGDVYITSGSAYVMGYNIAKDTKQVQHRMGYCPQFDGLILKMTGREMLTMYARLRGLPEANIPPTINRLIEMLDFADYADQMARVYSMGVRRRLNAAIALVGDPPVVLLDEPSWGMDPKGRRQLWDVLAQKRTGGTTMLLTSHSMEECEALCTRIAIMVNGRFQCLGSGQHLKSKFGEGYTFIVQLSPLEDGSPAPNAPVISFIQEHVEGCELFDHHQNYLHFRAPDCSGHLGRIFQLLEDVKGAMHIADYSVQQTTLEQVFLSFTQEQKTSKWDPSRSFMNRLGLNFPFIGRKKFTKFSSKAKAKMSKDTTASLAGSDDSKSGSGNKRDSTRFGTTGNARVKSMDYSQA